MRSAEADLARAETIRSAGMSTDVDALSIRIHLASVRTSLAETQAASARNNMLPQVTLHAAFEADRQRFVTQGGDNWLVSIGLRWTLLSEIADAVM